MGMAANDAAQAAFAARDGSAAVGASNAVRALDHLSLVQVHGRPPLFETFVLIVCHQYCIERPF
jgi:hypothetical protein